MAATENSSYTMVQHQLSVSRPLLSTSSTEEKLKDHDSTATQRWQLAAATAAKYEEQIIHEPSKSKACADDDKIHHILDTSKHKHYRRRRSGVSIKLSKLPASIEMTLQHQQAEATQQLIAWQDAMTEHAHLTQKCCHDDEHGKQELEQALKNQDNLNASPAADQQGAIVIHKPQPLPLRPSILSPSPFSVFSCSFKLLFDREHAALLQWQKKDFQSFTEEVQESLGGTLKKHLREYHRAFELLRQPVSSGPGKDGNQVTTDVAALSGSSSSPKDDEYDEGEDEREVYLRTRKKYLWHYNSPNNEGIRQLLDAAGSSRPQTNGADSVRHGRPQAERRSRREKINSGIPGAIIEGYLQEGRMEMVMEAFVKAREAVVSVREVSQRIEEHRIWMQLELNLTRLELMNLKFCRCDSPRAVLREAMELAATVRSFILELSSALDCNEVGVPWPLSRKADCSDVTPLFIKHLVATLPASAT